MTTVFEGVGKVVIGSWAAVAGFFVGLFSWTFLLATASGLPHVPDLMGFAHLSFNAGVFLAVVAFAWVITR